MEATRDALNDEQSIAIQWIDQGYNTFLTGVAGTGKTFLLNAWLSDTDKNVAITASTGIAATHLGGQTLHSWLAAAPERDTVTRLCTNAWRERHAPRLASIDVLVIDEISMVDGKLLELAEGAHRYARENDVPWGGVQIVMVGDLGQLPPVQAQENGWCFQSRAWATSKVQIMELCKTMRQADQEFADLLRKARVGDTSYEMHQALEARVGAYDPSKDAVRLMTHNDQADEVNDCQLEELDDIKEFHASETGARHHLNRMHKHCLSPLVLKVAVDARVMFTRNDPAGRFVNGTMGEVTGFNTDMIHVLLDNGDEVEVGRFVWEMKEWTNEGLLEVVASRTQFPLRLAWAITIHKSQGMSLDRVSVDLSRCFSPGQAYVALSRCRSLEGLNIEDWKGLASIMVHPMIRTSYGATVS